MFDVSFGASQLTTRECVTTGFRLDVLPIPRYVSGVDRHDSNAAARKRGRPRKRPVRVRDLQGFKFFKRLRGLLEALHPCAAHRNRLLHFDEYAAAVLFYFFNPAITSLRGLQRATGFAKVQRALGPPGRAWVGIRRPPRRMGAMSESVRLFEPALPAEKRNLETLRKLAGR